MLKNYLYVILIGFFAIACGPVKPLTVSDQPDFQKKDKKHTLKFIENVSIKPFGPTGNPVYKDIQKSSQKNAELLTVRNPNLIFSDNIENINWLQFKYSISLDVPVEALNNAALLSYMDEWYGTPYHYGGLNKNGIDCSAFSAGLMCMVFGVIIPRTVKEQYKADRHIRRRDLKEGDLVFFNTKKGVSHVGVYLLNNKFIHASTNNGVMISDLDDYYFKKRYLGARRVVSEP